MTNEGTLARRNEGGYTGGYPPTGINELVEIASQTNQIKELGSTLIASGLLPDGVKKPESAVAIMVKGAEIGLSAMYALSHIAIINGKPAMSAEAMLALVQRSGHRIRIVETTSEKCAVVGVRREDPKHPTRIEWTMEDAKRAQLAGKGPWKTYPRAMLRSRAISELCRATFADVLSGVSYVPEELGAFVNEDGEIIDVEPHRESYGEIEGEAEVETLSEAEQTLLRELIEETGHSVETFEEKIGPINEILQSVGEKWIERLRRESEAQNESPAKSDEDYELSEEDVREIEEIPS